MVEETWLYTIEVAVHTVRHDTEGAGKDKPKGISVQVGDTRLVVSQGHKAFSGYFILL